MKYKNRIQGFTLIELVIVLTIISGLFATYGPQFIQQQVPISQADEAGKDISEIKAAANAYYMENRAWPVTVNELMATGYLPGTGVSPFGTNYTLGNNGQNLVVSVDTNREQLANMLAGKVSFGAIAADGETVSTEMGTPSREAVQSFFLARRAVAGCADCNQLAAGTDLDINGNDLNNINEMDVNLATITNATITTADIDRLEAERIDLGANSLTHAGNQLNLNAGVVSVNGRLSANGDVVGNGNDLTGFDTVSADSGVFTDLTATTGTITTLSGNTLDYNSGSIDTLNGNSLTYSNGSIASLDGSSLDYNTGVIRSLSGNSLNFGAGTIGNLSGNDASFLSGLIRVLNGNTLTYRNVNGTTGNFINLSSNNGTIANMGVTGNSSFNILDSNNGNVTTLTATNGNIVTGVTKTASGNSITVSGTSSFGVLDSDRIDTNSFSGNSVTADNGSVSGNALVGTLSVTNLNVSNRLQTNIIDSSTSSLGNASASRFSISGRLVASGINTSTASFDNAVIQSASGNNANYNTVSANRFNGGAFTSNDDFYTPISSVNKNYLLIDEQKNKLDNCVDVTKFCLPETPSVNVICPTCKSSAARSSFSGVATASISGCRQGCTYRWITSGSGLSFSGCTSGSIAQGGSASPSCRVSTSLGPQESASGNIQIIVTNSHYTSEVSSDSVTVSYANTTPNNPFIDVKAGCWIDTAAFDVARNGVCSAFSRPGASVNFSAGEYLGRENFEFTNASLWRFSWSGDCSGSGSRCRTNLRTASGEHLLDASVRIEHISSGIVRNYSVKVFGCVVPEGYEANC